LTLRQAAQQGLWYLNTLSVPGKLEVSGASVPGVPFVLIGRNQHIAWSFVHDGLSADEELRTSPANTPTETCSQEPVAVRGSESQPLGIKCSRDGPLLAEHVLPIVRASLQPAKSPLAEAVIKVPALTQPLSTDFLLKINTAESSAAFVKGVESIAAPALRFVWVDKTGSIGSVTSGR
jgi:penicillin amidase